MLSLGKIPVVLAERPTDCGPASLLMALGLQGIHATLAELRTRTGAGRDGTSVLSLVRAARELGLHAQGRNIDRQQLRQLHRGSILFWEGNHFVVLDRCGKGWVQVVDPNLGHRKLPLEAFWRSFSNVAVVFGRARPLRRLRAMFAGRGRLSFLWGHFRLPLVLLALAAGAAEGAVVAVAFLVVGSWGDRLPLLASIAAACLVHVAAVALRGELGHRIAERFRSRCEHVQLEAWLDSPWLDLARIPPGELRARMAELGRMRTALGAHLPAAVFAVAELAGRLLMMAASGTWLLRSLSILSILALVWAVASRFRPRAGAVPAGHGPRGGEQPADEIATVLDSIKALGGEGSVASRWHAGVPSTPDAAWMRWRGGTARALAHACLRAAPLVLLVEGARAMAAAPAQTPAVLLGLLGALGVFEALQRVVLESRELARGWTALPRSARPISFSVTPEVTATVRPDGSSLVLEGVGVAAGQPARSIVSNVSFALREQRFVLITGRSGTGKSLLAEVMAGIREPSAGRVRIDGLAPGSWDPQRLRRRVALLGPRAQLVPGSIRRNIAAPWSEDEAGASVPWAAEIVGLAPSIERLPMGYATPLGQLTWQFGAGFLDQLLIARYVRARPHVLVLDASTSQLDALTARAMITRIVAGGIQVVIFTARPLCADLADEILVLAGDGLHHRGTHRDLLQTSPLYREITGQVSPSAAGRRDV